MVRHISLVMTGKCTVYCRKRLDTRLVLLQKSQVGGTFRCSLKRQMTGHDHDNNDDSLFREYSYAHE